MSFGNETDREPQDISDINMTPLVDVMLVLLVIFIITVPVLTQSINIDLPIEGSIKKAKEDNTITVSIDNNLSLYWNEAPIDKNELTQRLAISSRSNPQPSIALQGARDIAYEEVIQIMAAIEQAGITQIGFVTQLK